MAGKILILGAGNAQIDAIEYCKSHGIEVTGCSHTVIDSGIPLLDNFEQVDIKDVPGVVALAKKFDVDVVYSIGSDLAMPTVMKASEELGTPHFISSQSAANCHSKHLMRQTLGKGFRGNVDFAVCSNLEEAKAFTKFPGMMKPVDSQGQRGCFRVDSFEDIAEHFDVSLDYSIEGKVIIEEFVDGPEISVNAYMQDGKLKFALISDRIVFDEFPGGIIKEHVIPTVVCDEEASELTIDLVKRAAVALGLNNGPAYFQIKLRDGKEPIILEVAPRLDGCHMWNLIKHYCGVDLLDACFRHLLNGESVLDDEPVIPEGEYRLQFMCGQPGCTFDRDDYDTADALYSFAYLQTGDKIRKMNGYMEKCGYQIRRMDD